MFQQIESLDQQLFLWLNGFHCPWGDEVMWTISSKWLWMPLYLFILYQLFKSHKKEFLHILVLIIIVIGLSDWISSGVIKDSVKRYRPSHNTELASQVHVYKQADDSEYRGGTYGFVSSHAANCFAIATLAFLFLRRKSKHWGWLFLWAAVVAYSRIYLGVHYPLDILGGAMVGIAVTLTIYFGSLKIGFIKDCEQLIGPEK
jgi:undecaprenyl-diphosphatase